MPNFTTNHAITNFELFFWTDQSNYNCEEQEKKALTIDVCIKVCRNFGSKF